MTVSAPSLTALMTVHNGMPYIREAVRSMLEQSLKGFTLLIVDSGSTDGTLAYLEALRETFAHDVEKSIPMPRLLLAPLNENVGRTRALMHGLSLVESEITAIMDADNIAAPTRLEKQYRFLQERSDIDLVGSDITYIDGTGNRIRYRHFPEGHKALMERMALGSQFAHSACAYRTEAARKAGGYPSSFRQMRDSALWVAMMEQGSTVASIPEPLVEVRLHAGRASRSLAFLMVRAKESFRLSQSMQRLPGLGPAGRQAALARGSWSLMRLSRKKLALKQLWRSFCVAPWLFPWNPLFWRPLFDSWSRRRHWWKEESKAQGFREEARKD